ncbi:hypothetical protein EDB92DRAFT_2033247 [Lactarius akahatsu]|uniref:F-box domain-containing protein n=1 Tax=Lactarius akahatsu TaxID=416441 RepID=A0AAD4L8R4_9AGAM|nr:hypothetical protein EDB92DRAFT_2033247 [Lactarius akahatsu]
MCGLPNRRALVRHISRHQVVTIPRECTRNVTIGKLSDEVLLNIFRYYLDASPRFWPRLVHICRKWRHIVFLSQRTLHLRLFCTHGTPVLKALDCWPALPIVVRYGGPPALNPPAPKDEDNIMAALKRSDRVTSISLTVTRSLLAKILTIEETFSKLEELFLLSRDNMQVTLPSAIRWGPRLRRLHLTGIGFPPPLWRLSSSGDLVDIRLHGISNSGFLSPKALTNTLSKMARLQSLSLHFLSTANRTVIPLLSGERVILPALTHLDFRGDTEYVEDLLARIDAPRCRDIEITLLDEPIFRPSPRKFWMDMQKSQRRADILFSEHSVSISLSQPAPTCLKLRVFCEPLNQQLFSITQVCRRFSAFLFCVQDLCIEVTRLSNKEVGAERWLELIHSFEGTKWPRVVGDQSKNTVITLQSYPTRHEMALLAVHKLYISQPGPRHAPLREAVVSFMVSRRLSGHPIRVEYEPLCHISQLRGTGPLSHQVTIEALSDDVLLNIFRHNLGTSPRFWPTLTHVCQRWRQIVFTSPLGLDLRLYCTYGTPVLKTLDCWPALPIIVHFGGSPTLGPPTTPEDEDNIVAALKHSDCVCSIGLTITTSLLAKLCAIEKPFSTLEELVLRSMDDVQLTLPSTLTWGTRLRSLHSTRIAFPALPQLLSSSENLVNLRLHEIPSSGYMSPKALANALSGTTQLQSLSLHFLSPSSYPSHTDVSPLPGERVVLPALSRFKFQGTSEYLNDLVTRIDTPRLGDIEIRFFNQLIFHISQLCCFIDRIEMYKPHRRAEILSSEHAISVTFTQPEADARLTLEISSEQLDWQLSSMAQICDQFSSSGFFFGVGDLHINTTQPSSGQDDGDSEHWPGLIHSFIGVERLSLAGQLMTNILRTLRAADQETSPLSALKYLCIQCPVSSTLQAAIRSFVIPRRPSGRHINVEYIGVESVDVHEMKMVRLWDAGKEFKRRRSGLRANADDERVPGYEKGQERLHF